MLFIKSMQSHLRSPAEEIGSFDGKEKHCGHFLRRRHAILLRWAQLERIVKGVTVLLP
jgi:hypothetical protein